ncbi:hypothetical protein B0H14DRAFT_3012795, partial [Mycena olivaceomarginata]
MGVVERALRCLMASRLDMLPSILFLVKKMESAERAQIIDWLSPLNFFLRQADISRTRQPGTGEWLL